MSAIKGKNKKYLDQGYGFRDYFLPKDTLTTLNAMRPNPLSIENFNLKLNKLARFFPQDNGRKFAFAKDLESKDKGYWIEPDFSCLDIKAINQRHAGTLTALKLKMGQLSFTPAQRLIIGLGIDTVYETGITLDHIYGLPIIPASAVKGVLRNWIIINLFDGVEGNQLIGALADPGFCTIFGSPKQSKLGSTKGVIHFFDAFPTGVPKIVADIINPHYGPYYSDESGQIPPADYHAPVPVFFLTVEKTNFAINYGIAADADTSFSSGVFTGLTPLKVVEEWLPKTLAQHGIGAKTAVGYGVNAN